jgi:hypothetical protein
VEIVNIEESTNYPKHASNPSISKSIYLPFYKEKYVKLLGGPPEIVSMNAGCVALSTGESFGLHNSGDFEEVIIPL